MIMLSSDFGASVNCVLGLVPEFARRCECSDCRYLREQAPDERLAVRVAAEARKRWKQDKPREQLVGA